MCVHSCRCVNLTCHVLSLGLCRVEQLLNSVNIAHTVFTSVIFQGGFARQALWCSPLKISNIEVKNPSGGAEKRGRIQDVYLSRFSSVTAETVGLIGPFDADRDRISSPPFHHRCVLTG